MTFEPIWMSDRLRRHIRQLPWLMTMLSHKVSFGKAGWGSRGNPNGPRRVEEPRRFPVNGEKTSHSINPQANVKPNNPMYPRKEPGSFNSGVWCAYCKTEGHIISGCRKWERKKQARNFTPYKMFPNALVNTVSHPPYDDTAGKVASRDVPSKCVCVREDYKPYMSEGFVSLIGDATHRQPITILRDTGASQSILLEGILPLSEKCLSESSVLVLVFLPIPKQPLQARYFGSYVVEKKIGEVDYVVQTPGRRKRPRDGVMLTCSESITREMRVVNLERLRFVNS